MRLPNDTQRLTIVGRTGTGKTYAAVWHLSKRSWDRMPWIVYDFKMDDLINEIPGIRHITTNELPKHPGIYACHPHPDDILGVQNQMWKIWEQENTGVYVDEGYMVSGIDRRNPAFRSILTQGRSKRIPVIVLSQRPVWMDKFVFTESDFYQIFALNNSDDREHVSKFAAIDRDANLPDYHSWYYDVGRNETVVLKPVPDKSKILEIFELRMPQVNRRIFI